MAVKIDTTLKSVDLDKLVAAADPLAMQNAASRVNETVQALTSALKPATAALDRFAESTSSTSALRSVWKDIERQRALIDDMARVSALPSPPRLTVPQIKNPILETNKRLAKIESRFEKMEAIALEGARIATGLQAYAAEFLQKFEVAAAETDNSARRAVRIGIVAIGIAVAVPAAQTAFELFWDRPTDVSALASAIDSLKATIDKMQALEKSPVAPVGESVVRLPILGATTRPMIEPVTYKVSR